MKALLVVDMQNDFMPGGALPVSQGNEIIPVINEIVHYPFDLVVATKDWHPADHACFYTNHAGKKAGDHINLGGLDQILWPEHCLQGTSGAEFAPGWDTTQVNKVIHKGTNPFIDSYSAFFDNGHRQSTELENYLREKGVNEVFIAGVATDYCVKFSVLDALQVGFKTFVIIDACRGIDLKKGDSENAILKMRQGGAIILSFKDLKRLLEESNKGHSML